MARTRIVSGLMAALLLVLAPAALGQDSTGAAGEQPATPLAGPGLLEPLGIDIRASSELSPEELQARIDQLTAALEQPELPDDAKTQLGALLEADRAELTLRQAAAPQEPATPDQPVTEEATTPAEPADAADAQAEQPAEIPADQTTEPTVEQPAAPAESAAETGTESTAAAEEQPAPPPAPETTAEQPAAPDQPAAATEQPEQPAAEAAAAAPAETPSVDAPPEVDPAAETKAAALLADRTPAESLTDDALKARVEQYRDLLGETDLSRKTAKALRQRLKADREALRARVAAQEAAEAAAQQQAATQQKAAPAEEQAQQPTQTTNAETQATATQAQQSKTQQQALTAQPGAADAPESVPLEIAPLLPMVLAPTVQEIPMLLQDERPAAALADDELNRRILATRQALQDKQDYSQDDLTLFDRQLRADRQELNNRLLADRTQRAAAYKEWKNPNLEINTEPEIGEPEAPSSIFAAEVDDAEMWDQIVTAPLEPIKRRYSRHEVTEQPDEIMNRPEVREALPSIELDTITFGFNEAFVREEEIFDLDRIARMIESVVAAYPDEIFMIEGHTDAVGSDAYNLKLSRQRAQAVKTALSRYYVIPPRNLATVGLGERYLKIWTPDAEEENRRVTVRRVTPLVSGYDPQ